MIVLHIHDIIRYSQKKMTEKYLCAFTLFQNIYVGISTLFAYSKTKKKVDAARFLDKRGDEKQVINLEWPKLKKLPTPKMLPVFYFSMSSVLIYGLINFCLQYDVITSQHRHIFI